MWLHYSPLTCQIVNTSAVHDPREELHPDDGINDNDEEDEESDLEERHDGLQDGIHNYLQTCQGKVGSH